MTIANILWTSGWDSTYRVATMTLIERAQVQPWYVVDSVRPSTKRELNTLEKLRSALVAKDSSVAQRILPLKIVRKEDIPEDQKISKAYQNLAAQGHLGSQYDWLARLAKAENVVLELSIHRDDKAHRFLDGHTRISDDGVHYLADEHGNDLFIFRGFSFPLFDLSKLDMQKRAQQKGIEDIMEMTWFCFFPLLDGRPCGFCNPCKYTREEGLDRRVPSPSLFRKVQYLAFRGYRRLRTLGQHT